MSAPRNRRPLKVIGNPPEGWHQTSIVPDTRAHCPPPGEICSHVWCRHHGWRIDGADRPGRYRGRMSTVVRVIDGDPCVLNAVDRHPDGMSARQIAAALGLRSKRRVEQLLAGIAEKLRNGGELVAAGVVDGLEANHDLSVRTSPEKERDLVVPYAPPVPFASVVITAKIGDREVSVTLDGDTSTSLMAVLRDSHRSGLRALHRQLRLGLTSEDGR